MPRVFSSSENSPKFINILEITSNGFSYQRSGPFLYSPNIVRISDFIRTKIVKREREHVRTEQNSEKMNKLVQPNTILLFIYIYSMYLLYTRDAMEKKYPVSQSQSVSYRLGGGGQKFLKVVPCFTKSFSEAVRFLFRNFSLNIFLSTCFFVKFLILPLVFVTRNCFIEDRNNTTTQIEPNSLEHQKHSMQCRIQCRSSFINNIH